MQNADLIGRKCLLQGTTFAHHGFDAALTVILDMRVDNIRLPAFGKLVANEIPNLWQLSFASDKGLNCAASLGQLVDNRYIQITIKGKSQRAWNRSRCHDQQVRIITFAQELFAL